MGNSRDSKYSKLKLLNSDIRNSIRTISEKDLKKKYNIPLYELEELEVIKNRLFKLLIFRSKNLKLYNSLFNKLMNCKSADDYMQVYNDENSDGDDEFIKSSSFVYYDLNTPRGIEEHTNYFLTLEKNIESSLYYGDVVSNPYILILKHPELKQIILSGYYFLWVNDYCYTSVTLGDCYLETLTDKKIMSNYDMPPVKIKKIKKHLADCNLLENELNSFKGVTPDLSFFYTKKGKPLGWVKEWYEAVCELIDKFDIFIKMGIVKNYYDQSFPLFSRMVISPNTPFESDYMSIAIEYLYENNYSFPDFNVFAAFEDDATYTNSALLCFGSIEKLIEYISALVKMNIDEIRKLRPCIKLDGL